MIRASALPFVRLGGAQIAIGAAAIFARYALTGAGPIAVSALRLAIATFALALFARGFRILALRREAAFALAGAALAIHFVTWITSLVFTSVAVSTLLVTTTPLWTELFDIVRERRPPTRAFVVALVLGFAGVALIAHHGARTPSMRGNAWLGDALALVGAVAIGAYLLVVRDAARDARGGRMSTRQIVVRTYGWAALLLTIASAFAHQGPPSLTNEVAWAGIAAMALVSQLLGHTALNASLATFSPSIVAFSTLCEPVVAAVLAALFLRERLTMATLVGGALVLAAVTIALRVAQVDRVQP